MTASNRSGDYGSVRWQVRRLCVPLLLGFAIVVAPRLAHGAALQLEGGVSVNHSDEWSAVKQANLQKLVSGSSEITIYVEHRSDHAEAVRRLKSVEAETDTPSTFLSIGGWPALQRRQFVAKPLPGETAPAPAGDEMLLVVTTAVAADDLLVRLESRLPSNASTVADQVEAIGRELTFAATGDAAQVQKEIDDLRSAPPAKFPETSDASAPDAGALTADSSGGADDGFLSAVSAGAADASGAPVRITNQAGRDSELEVAAAPNGRNIVVGSNNGYFFSTNGGQTWTASTGLGSNDPSLAWGSSGGANGTFYAANIASPSTAISISTDNGQTFAFQANAYTCGQNGDPACGAAFPDQEHIAADRLNLTAQGDQVYSVWRHLNGNWGIVCSRDNGATWSTNGFFTGGDFPRVGVGPDGFVYVVYFSGNDIMLSKFNSCESNQNPMVKAIADQDVVMGTTYVACPTPGLDRCNFRNTLASPMVAVDETDANHVYVAYAVNTNPGGGGAATCTNQNTCNENVIVQDSVTGGTNFSVNPANKRIVTLNTGAVARRFMPWICALNDTAYVTWYDRRAASAGGTTVSNNSLTDVFGSSAFRDLLGNLANGPEFQVNAPGTADAQCEAGAATGTTASWPSVTDQSGDSESCSLQPQLAGFCCVPGDIDGSGRCLNPSAASSQQRCDFNPDTCPAGQQCAANRGAPKYGDYNGNACAGGRVLMAWASATPPPGIAASGNIDSFFTALNVSSAQIQVPGGVVVPDTCVGNLGTATLTVCNTGKADLEVDTITSSNPLITVTTPSSGYPVVISHDFCFPFQVRFAPTTAGAQSATLTIPSNDPLNPSLTVSVSSTGTVPDIRVTGSGNFGDVCAEDVVEKTISICNVGGCNLDVSAASVDCPDFTLINNPFPATVSHDFCLGVTVRFTPQSIGPKACQLTINSNDPDSPTVNVPLTGNTPAPSIDVPPDLPFPPTVVQETGVCKTPEAFPVSNKGQCDLRITEVATATNAPSIAAYSLDGLPSYPIILEPGHIVGEGDLSVVFAPHTPFDRDVTGTVRVTYVSEPILNQATTETRALCGESVNTGARVLVTENGVPVQTVEKIQLQRITGNRRKKRVLQSVGTVQDVTLKTVTPAAPCQPFQYHYEWSTVDNPIQLVTGSYQITATIRSGGRRLNKTVGFSLDTCDFNANVTVEF